jgi:anhydro-N-acetylmuramic acid kinase
MYFVMLQITMVNTYNIIGVMSGTSLDGLDIAYCNFIRKNNKWTFSIKAAETIKYSNTWKDKLKDIENSSALNLALLNIEFGKYTGDCVQNFIKRNKPKAIDFVASHGHTVFHQPDKNLTLQIGSGAAIAAQCKQNVVCDFRSLDVALCGQGAPLVPIGDELLFNDYDYCLNLGGFANVSFKQKNNRIAFDICPINIVLNMLVQKAGKEYDKGGMIAGKGKINDALLKKLNDLKFYQTKAPKSLGKEWVLKNIFPIIEKSKLSVEDALATFVEHVAIQINNSTSSNKKSTILVTGGGAFNNFLIQRITVHTKHQVIIPDENTINFKEALIFAFLGLLRWEKKENCLKSVTGASQNNIGGCIYQFK